MLPHDFPPWEAVYQQTLAAGVFEAMAHDLSGLLRLASGREPEPTAAILDSRTLRSTPESGARGGYDGAKRKKGFKVHAAVDTLGHLLALRVSPADEQDRAQVEELARSVQEATGESVELAYVDRGYAGEEASEAAEASGIRLEVVRHPGPRRASSCCLAGGWWSAPSRGRRGFADSPRTTRGCPQRWRGCTSSPSPAFSSTGPSPRSCQVRNTVNTLCVVARRRFGSA